ncbi:MAG: dienelactone hydrolase family protein [Fimbriimonas sp.]
MLTLIALATLATVGEASAPSVYSYQVDPKLMNEMLRKRVSDLCMKGGEVPAAERRKRLAQSLGLDPLPPKTELRAQITGVYQRDGYRLEKLRYEARPGELVTAHLYMPDGPGPFPVVLNPHGHWSHKKSTAHVQSRGISLALYGYAALIVDSPGVSWDDNVANERKAMGSHDDWWASMGASLQGVYVWDLMRGLDYLETRKDCDTSKVGITGTSGGGTATMYAFAMDDRIKAAVPVCYIASYETATTDGCLCNHVPGSILLGDRSDILGIRAPAPAMIIGATVDADFPLDATKLAFEKLKKIYKDKKAEDKCRLEIVESNHDYNRRMREAMLAFFAEHLKGEPRRGHLPELRPLTDGGDVTYPSGTLDAENPELLVTKPEERQTIGMREILRRSLLEPYPEAYNVDQRLVRWAKYGRLPELRPGAIIAIHDSTIEAPKEPNSLPLPVNQLNQRECIYIGLSVSEVLAQILHSSLPGAPEGWEANSVLGSDALTSMIASVKTLAGSTGPGEPPKMIVAEGPISSMVAKFLKLYRPDLQIEVSHKWSSWTDLLDSNIKELSQPSARYMAWPG